MRGQVLGVDPDSGRGEISGIDSARYSFSPAEWRLPTSPQPGQVVDFEIGAGRAFAIYAARQGYSVMVYAPGAEQPQPQVQSAGAPVRPAKDRTAAVLLAIFLSALGIHKFYLGKTGAGVALLLGFLFG